MKNKRTSWFAVLTLLVFVVIIALNIAMRTSSAALSEHSIRLGRVVWRLVDAQNDISELLIDGKCVAYGGIEIYDNGGQLLGYCCENGAEKDRLFMVDSALSATNSVVWYDDVITALRNGMPRFDSSKCGTFLDFYKKRIRW